MSKLTKRNLESSVVPLLPPETLHQLIRHRGLEACGELLTHATPAQLTSVLDLDLWRHTRPGRDHAFDIERFGEWLEVLVDTGESIAARTVAALDQDIVVAGLSRHIRVFDPGIFEPTAQSDDESIDRADAMREGGGSWLECEVGGYIVRARRTAVWDAIIALLVVLEDEHSDRFHEIMQGCRGLSNSRPETSAFHDLLFAPEQHLHDLALERERRRGQQGFASPADARAFLEMARRPKNLKAPNTANPIVTAYFRAADETPDSSSASTAGHRQALPGNVTESIEAVEELLAEAGVVPDHPRALLAGSADEAESAPLNLLRRLMTHACGANEDAYLTRGRELAFLANTLLEGCSVQSRSFTPREASDAAAATCNLGLETWPDQLPDSFLIHHDLITVFEAGWSVLHRDVGMFAADQLIATLADLQGADRDLRLELAVLRRTLAEQREAGTPWKARHAAEILAMLDVTAWTSVIGVLDECPVIPAAMTAVLEGRRKTVSPTEFAFISTADQIEEVRRFLRSLPDLLS